MSSPVDDRTSGVGSGITVGVTGATGFIGGRLIELISTQRELGIAAVRAFAHRKNKPGFPVLRLDDAAAVDHALAGCHVLVHCGFDFHDLPANVRIARVLSKVCADRNIRLVLLSSAAVYKLLSSGMFDETTPSNPSGVAYSDTKLAIEQEVLAQVRLLGLNAVILQPTVVYGPKGRSWTDTPARELLSGRVFLPVEGQGICNVVYVDDVCTAAIAASVKDIASGHRLIISGTAPITWGEFFYTLRAALGTGTISWMPPTEIAFYHRPSESVSTGTTARAIVLRLASQVMTQKVRSRIKYALKRIQTAGGEIVHMPKGPTLNLYASGASASIANARHLLNWEPQFDFQQGMIPTTEYLQTTFAAEIVRARKQQSRPAQSGSATPQPSHMSSGRMS